MITIKTQSWEVSVNVAAIILAISSVIAVSTTL